MVEDIQACLASLQKPEKYCEALELLLNEHEPLRKKMDGLYQAASLLAYNPKRADKNEILQRLHEEMNTFIEALFPHSKKEDHYLFRTITKYIGSDAEGPIALMQKEHGLVKKHITLFLEKYNVLTSDEEEVRELAYHVSGIFHTLTDHFLKEEEILFPLAESLLSDEDKIQLYQSFENIKAG